MSQYIIKVENTSGVAGTIISDSAFSYTDNLNELNEGQLRITGTGETKRGLFEIGSKVYFYRDGSLEFTGLINSLSYLDAGGISADLKGFEVWLGKENGTYANSPWTSTASETIAGLVIGESNFFTAGTVEAGASIDLKLDSSSSIYNALSSLTKSTAQDIGIDYTNLEVDILDHKGSSTSVATLNDRIQIADLTVRKSYPIANDVRVFGKGDGDNQITSLVTSGQDATSKSTYGTIQKDYNDPSIISQTQANNMADKLVAQWKDPVSVYQFEVINPNLSVVAGDVVTLNSQTKGLTNEEVRVVGIERGVRGDQEFLTLQVTNKEYSQKERSMEKYVAQLQKEANDQSTYMQGTTNILNFSEMINANSSAPLRVLAYLSANEITDEAGNLRINSFKLDYDVDPFRSGLGSATADNSTTGAGMTNSSSVSNAGISNASSTSNAGMTNTSARTSNSSSTTTATSRTFSSSWYSVINNWTGPSISSAENFAIWRYEITYVNGTSGTTIDNLGVRITDASGPGGSAGYLLYTMDNSLVIGEEYPVWTGVIPWEASGHHFYVDVKGQGGSASLINSRFTVEVFGAHTHSNTFDDASHTNSNSFNDASHTNLNSFDDASHNHDVSIGDVVSDAGSINATEVNIYVDFWNGSAWINKHSVLTTGKTIDFDVDLSDGGTYPDAAGFWRTRIFTDSANADLVQGTIKCRHELDT